MASTAAKLMLSPSLSPAISDEPPVAVTPAATATVPEKYTLLVVDDEEGPRQSLRMVFRHEFNVHTVDNGEAALQFAREHTVHVAILDIRMTGCSGIEVLKSLKEIDPKIEVLMLTAYETLETARQALRLGACDYLSKPFDLPAIREAAARALHLHKISETLAATATRLRDLSGRLGDSALREEMARTTNEIYAGVLHDINNPLTVISGYVELLDMRLQQASALHGADLAEVRDNVSTIAKQVNTCTAIAKRYLRFVHRRASAGQTLPVNQIINDVQTLLKAHPAVRRGRLAVRLLGDDAETSMDATDFIQVLLNLTINAFQSGSGSQTVWITAERVTTPLSLPHLGSPLNELLLGLENFPNTPPLLALTVLDEGVGISAEHLPHIFDAYFTTKAQSGTGLGLAIVARLVRTHHGFIHVKTRLGEGTSMTLYLPLKS
jgi:two-component system sensor histidine kinase/response regulator